MSITLNDHAIDVFKLYDELAVAYAKDIDGYKSLYKALESMIVQKEELLESLKNQTIDLIKSSMSFSEGETSFNNIIPESAQNSNEEAVDENVMTSAENIVSEEVVSGVSNGILEKESLPSQKRVSKSIPKRQRKTSKSAKRKIKTSEKSKKRSLQSNIMVEEIRVDQLQNASETKTSKVELAGDSSELKCIYHPEVKASDRGRQLCSSCRWKLINNGLINYDKEPEVISFLKGEITKFPSIGQPMCPIHPDVPSYNRKTGLCKVCQRKAKSIGIQDRPLTEEELFMLRNPSM